MDVRKNTDFIAFVVRLRPTVPMGGLHGMVTHR